MRMRFALLSIMMVVMMSLLHFLLYCLTQVRPIAIGSTIAFCFARIRFGIGGRTGGRRFVRRFIKSFGLVIDATDYSPHVSVQVQILSVLAHIADGIRISGRKERDGERMGDLLLDFFRPKPSLSTVFSVHTTLRLVDDSALRCCGRRRRIPVASSYNGGGSEWVAVRVIVWEDEDAALGGCLLLMVVYAVAWGSVVRNECCCTPA